MTTAELKPMAFGQPRNPKVDELIKALKEVKPGEVFTYLKIKELTGRDPQKKGRGWLNSARKELEKSGVIFKNVVNVGVCRQTSGQAATEEAEKDRSQIARKTRRAIRKLTALNGEELSSEEKKSKSFHLAVFGLMSVAAKRETIQAISAGEKPAPKIDQGRLIEFLTK